MATPIYDKPDYTNGIWAYSGTRVVPSDDKVAQGHIVERPPYEISNYLENRQDQGIAYLLQNGFPSWDAITTYPAGAFVKKDGLVYTALSNNTDRDPASSSAIWTRAFYSYLDGSNLAGEINNIKNTDGYLSLYVSRSDPQMTGRAWGYGYLAQTGLSSTGEENVGYAFRGNGADGIFHDGEVAVALNNGSLVARFKTPASPTESTKNVVTMDVLRQALEGMQGYGVGDIYITTSLTPPATRFGYGTWEKFAQGCTLVGHSDRGTDPNWTRTVMNFYGEYDHILTIPEMPSHNHNNGAWTKLLISTGSGTCRYFDSTAGEPTLTDNGIRDIMPAGGDQPHNNVQPSIVVYFWRRIA